MDQNEERITALETKLAYQELAAGELSRQSWEQQKRIEVLEEQIRLLAKKLKEMGEGALPPLPTNERPPHY